MDKTATTRYDIAEHLRTFEEMAAYIEACLEAADGDAAFIAKALGDVACANLYRIIDETGTPHEPAMISGKRTSAALPSAEDWRAIQETLCLLAVPGMRESIKVGMAEPLSKSAKVLKWQVGRPF